MPDRTPVTAINVGPLSGTLTVLLTMLSASSHLTIKYDIEFKVVKEKEVKATLRYINGVD